MFIAAELTIKSIPVLRPHLLDTNGSLNSGVLLFNHTGCQISVLLIKLLFTIYDF